MAGVDDLKAAVAAVVTAVTDGVAAVTAEIAAVDAAIAKLQAAVAAGGLSQDDAEALAVELQGVSSNLGTATTELTAETTKVSGL